MKRITASMVGLITAGLVTVAVASAANEPAAKTAAVTIPAPTATVMAVPDANKTFMLIRKRVMIQKEITALETHIRNNQGSAALRQEIMEIEAKITELQNHKRNLIMAAEPKLKELYRQLGDISGEIAQKTTATPPPKP